MELQLPDEAFRTHSAECGPGRFFFLCCDMFVYKKNSNRKEMHSKAFVVK